MAELISNVEHAETILKNSDMVVFSETGEPVGAYPFTLEAREHKVLVNGHEVHAMCALDALAVSPMFGMKTQISSKCRIAGSSVVIHQSGKTIDNPEVADDGLIFSPNAKRMGSTISPRFSDAIVDIRNDTMRPPALAPVLLNSLIGFSVL